MKCKRKPRHHRRGFVVLSGAFVVRRSGVDRGANQTGPGRAVGVAERQPDGRVGLGGGGGCNADRPANHTHVAHHSQASTASIPPPSGMSHSQGSRVPGRLTARRWSARDSGLRRPRGVRIESRTRSRSYDGTPCKSGRTESRSACILAGSDRAMLSVSRAAAPLARSRCALRLSTLANHMATNPIPRTASATSAATHAMTSCPRCHRCTRCRMPA